MYNENTTFKTPNGGISFLTSQTDGLILTETEHVDLEYSILASTTAVVDTTYCFRVTDAGVANLEYSTYAEATIIPDVTVSTLGTQTSFIDIPDTTQYIGGAFVVTDDVKSRDVTDITITASGTVDAFLDMENITLRYDLDSSATPDCSTVSYDDTDTLFGSIDVD